MQVQHFDAADGWAINYINLSVQGGFTLGTYQAWAETAPAFTQGAYHWLQTTTQGYGGSEFGLHYDAGPTDPSGNGVHWIQLISTNTLLNNTHNPNGDYDAGNGFFYYIDDASNNLAVDGPFYDAKGSANTTDFVDVIQRQYSLASQLTATAYIVTEPAANTLNIYDGVTYGFYDPLAAPEPPTWALAVMAAVVLFLFVGYRRLGARVAHYA